MRFVLLSERNRERYLRVIRPVGVFLARLHVHPNIVSVAGLVLSGAAALLYGMGVFIWAGCILILAGTCDVLDGQLARQAGRTSRFGAFLDSTLDRFSEIIIFLGLAWYFSGGNLSPASVGRSGPGAHSPVTVLFIVLAVGGSLMVSYTRARAEGLGLECKVGFMQRPERITLLIIGSLLAPIPKVGLVAMKVCLFLLAFLSTLTALQRMIHVNRLLVEEMEGGER